MKKQSMWQHWYIPQQCWAHDLQLSTSWVRHKSTTFI